MRMCRQVDGILAALILCVTMFPGVARATDYHVLFESRCAGCHGHAGEFAREQLVLGPNGVAGRSGRDLAPFLARHAGGLSADEIPGLLAMFASQIESEAMFGERCRICHDRAYEFVRLKLIERDGALLGRYSGRAVAPFLSAGHARLTPDEAAAMTEALTRILRGKR